MRGVHLLPQRGVGWWALGLLVVVALFPLWWGTLENLVANDVALVATAVAIGLAAFALAAVALFAAKDLSLLLSVLLGLTVAEVLAGLLVVVALFGQGETPSFPSLSQHPDASLRGTVAYLSDQSGCVRIRAAAGRPAKDVYCVPDLPSSEKKGKWVGPQLAWLPDGRLEVTMFRMNLPPGAEVYNLGWRRVVDVRTGKVERVPTRQVPTEPAAQPRPTVSPDGARLGWTSEDGRVQVTLTDAAGARTLLSTHGPSSTYRLDGAWWAPNWQWVAADDGRILVITTGDRPLTRVLTTEAGRGAAFNFAVSGTDFLRPAG